MKVCILSMQQIDNMGSLLQSYALKTTIEKLGNEVEFIDIQKRDDDYKLLGNYKQEYHEEREKDGLLQVKEQQKTSAHLIVNSMAWKL